MVLLNYGILFLRAIACVQTDISSENLPTHIEDTSTSSTQVIDQNEDGSPRIVNRHDKARSRCQCQISLTLI